MSEIEKNGTDGSIRELAIDELTSVSGGEGGDGEGAKVGEAGGGAGGGAGTVGGGGGASSGGGGAR